MYARLACAEIVFICRCSRQSWRTSLKTWRNWWTAAQVFAAKHLWILCWDNCGGLGQCCSAEWNLFKASMSHKEAEWRDFVIRVCKNRYFSACYNFNFLVKWLSCVLTHLSSCLGLLCSWINQRKVLTDCRMIFQNHLRRRGPWWIFRVFWVSLSTFKMGLSRSITLWHLYNTMWHDCLESQICSSLKCVLKSVRTWNLYRVTAEGLTCTHMHKNIQVEKMFWIYIYRPFHA